MEGIKEKDSHIGRKIGDFTVIAKEPSSAGTGKYELWLCRCDNCGTEVYFGKPRIEKEGASYKCRKCHGIKGRKFRQEKAPVQTEPVPVAHIINHDAQDPGERFVEIMTAIGHLAEEAAELSNQIKSRKRSIDKNRAVLLAIAQVFEKADKVEAKLHGVENEVENEG